MKLFLGAQLAPHQSCDPDQAGREQYQVSRFWRGCGRSSIADEFLRAWARARASNDRRVQHQSFKFARQSVLHRGRDLPTVDRQIVGKSVITTGNLGTKV